MKNKTLLIMAAGMGSRFGGLKQLEPIGPNGEFIIDYSIYDAIKAGFNKVVIIIKEENYDLFKQTIGNRIEDKIKVEYAFQKNTDLPKNYKPIEERAKPWGTSHAILSASKYINENFVVINADDFYGTDAYIQIAKFLDKTDENTTNYAIVGYEAAKTLTENGAVKRGICEIENGLVQNIIESSLIMEENGIKATPLLGGDSFVIPKDKLVSMNMFGFTKKIFPYLQENFPKFLEKNKKNILTCEYLIPESVSQSIKEGNSKVSIIKTTSSWYGITYKEDKEKIVQEIGKKIDNQEYPKNLFK